MHQLLLFLFPSSSCHSFHCQQLGSLHMLGGKRPHKGILKVLFVEPNSSFKSQKPSVVLRLGEGHFPPAAALAVVLPGRSCCWHWQCCRGCQAVSSVRKGAQAEAGRCYLCLTPSRGCVAQLFCLARAWFRSRSATGGSRPAARGSSWFWRNKERACHNSPEERLFLMFA